MLLDHFSSSASRNQCQGKGEIPEINKNAAQEAAQKALEQQRQQQEQQALSR